MGAKESARIDIMRQINTYLDLDNYDNKICLDLINLPNYDNKSNDIKKKCLEL
jgi:hypothetical protein